MLIVPTITNLKLSKKYGHAQNFSLCVQIFVPLKQRGKRLTGRIATVRNWLIPIFLSRSFFCAKTSTNCNSRSQNLTSWPPLNSGAQPFINWAKKFGKMILVGKFFVQNMVAGQKKSLNLNNLLAQISDYCWFAITEQQQEQAGIWKFQNELVLIYLYTCLDRPPILLNKNVLIFYWLSPILRERTWSINKILILGNYISYKK